MVAVVVPVEVSDVVGVDVTDVVGVDVTDVVPSVRCEGADNELLDAFQSHNL